ncbi:MAG: DoxX family protein [Planctomycetota bacterium]|nr:MAG: DoxX family protein [Planctomycetota bacterium]
MQTLRGMISLLGRLLISAIFLTSAVTHKIPHFEQVAQLMESEGVPMPKIALAGAIAFLVLGSLSLIVGFKARIGALLLLVFLILATYYFHDFWTMSGDERQQQMIHFMKNLALMGTMLLIIANGPGGWSLDARKHSSG